MDYSKYKRSRDVAWNMLIKHNISTLPVCVTKIAEESAIKYFSFETGELVLKRLGLSQQVKKSDGFATSIMFNGRLALILYNEKCSPQRCRFIIAHELGHIFCRDLKNRFPEQNEVYSLINSEPSETDNEEEQEANVFASRLLAPACVLHALHVQTAEEIAKLCNISMTSAQFRMERMRQLYEREQRFLSKKGVSCFGLSRLERQVLEQFQPYIKKHL